MALSMALSVCNKPEISKPTVPLLERRGGVRIPVTAIRIYTDSDTWVKSSPHVL